MRYTRGKGLIENYLARKRADKVDRLIPDKVRDGKILDIGCGSFPFFLKNTTFREKHGVDKGLSCEVENILFRQIDITKKGLPYEDHSFNLVTLIAVIEHFSEDKIVEVFKEVNRILHPEGLILVTTPTPRGHKALMPMAAFGIVSKKEVREHLDGGITEKDMKMYLKKARLEYKIMKSGRFQLGMNTWYKIDKK